MASRDAVPGMAEKLRLAREKSGLSQGDVQEATGVSRTTLSHYESDKKTPGVAVLRRLAKAYGVRTCDLIPEIEDAPPAAATVKAKKKRGAK